LNDGSLPVVKAAEASGWHGDFQTQQLPNEATMHPIAPNQNSKKSLHSRTTVGGAKAPHTVLHSVSDWVDLCAHCAKFHNFSEHPSDV